MTRALRCVPLLAVLAACGDDSPAQSFDGLSRISGQSPFPAGCAVQASGNFRGSEVEPQVAVDPLDPNHLIAAWQQDRWDNGGANGLGSAVSFDGGKSWTAGFAAFTRCSGGTAALGTDFERASDPWVTFAADGTPHQIALAFNRSNARQAMLAVRSGDGGRTWSEPQFLAREFTADIAIDKETITADPVDAKLVYAVWDRLTGVTTPTSPDNVGPAYIARTTDGGASWEAPRILYDPGPNAQTIGNQIVVLPNGTLVNLATVITQLNQPSSPAHAAVVRSADKGVTWSGPIEIAPQQPLGVLDPKTQVHIRTGDVVPAIAVDRTTGELYVAWEDSRFTGQRDGIALSRSIDGGLTWSPQPLRVNPDVTTQAFTPAVAARDGKVAVTYYDLREDDPSDGSRTLATLWMAVSSDGGATWQESKVGGPFDIRTAPRTNQGYFVGDYSGLVPSGSSFLPVFALANNGNSSNRTDVFARPPGAAVASVAVAAAPLIVPRVARGGMRRSF